MTRVVAVFDSPHAVERAIEALRKAGWRAVSVCSPAFDENLLQLVGATRSPVAASTLASGGSGFETNSPAALSNGPRASSGIEPTAGDRGPAAAGRDG